MAASRAGQGNSQVLLATVLFINQLSFLCLKRAPVAAASAAAPAARSCEPLHVEQSYENKKRNRNRKNKIEKRK